MDYLILSIIGLAMGLLGGMLGIGGSVVMIPAMTLVFGENQHLYQASAMICNVFVAAASVGAHRQANTLHRPTLRWMIPAGVVGIVLGVAGSNLPVFAGQRSYLLARSFGLFLVYVTIYNSYKLYRSMHPVPLVGPLHIKSWVPIPLRSATIGLITGLSAGLLGIGAGTVATPLQQILLKSPLRRAMSNSAALILCMAWLGAIYKNVTLTGRQVSLPFLATYPVWAVSLVTAWTIIPSALIGSYLGGHLMHHLPKNLVRGVFVIVVALAAFKLLTVV